MLVIFGIPVADSNMAKATDTFAIWHRNGYRTAAVVDGSNEPGNCDYLIRVDRYIGWADAVNRLSRSLVFDWLVTGGADVYPADANAADIAAECVHHFGGTFGVMQPTGDKYGALAGEAIACVSPWLGREWCNKINHGRGPLWPEYPHYFADAELMDVARLNNVLWLRDDLAQYHDHYLRHSVSCPSHLERWQSTWKASHALYTNRKADGFPWSERD